MNWTKRLFNQSRFGTIKAIWRVIVLVHRRQHRVDWNCIDRVAGSGFCRYSSWACHTRDRVCLGKTLVKKSPSPREPRRFRAGAAKIAHERAAQRVRGHTTNEQSLLYANSDSGLIKLSWRRTTTRYLEHWSPPVQLWSHRPSARMRSFSKGRVHVSLNFSLFCESCAISCADFAPCTSSVHV